MLDCCRRKLLLSLIGKASPPSFWRPKRLSGLGCPLPKSVLRKCDAVMGERHVEGNLAATTSTIGSAVSREHGGQIPSAKEQIPEALLAVLAHSNGEFRQF